MKLIRFGESGKEKPGVILDNQIRADASACTNDYDEQFFASDGLARLRRWLRQNSSAAPQVDPIVLVGPQVARPSKIAPKTPNTPA